jgi:hypothetical protein
MSKIKKTLLGVLTVLPPLYLVTFIVFFISMILTIDKQPASGGMPPVFQALMIAHLLTILLMFCLVTFYIFHVFNNNMIPQDKKVLWTILIFMGSFIAMPIYWYLFIWKDSVVSVNSSKTEQ